MEPLQKKQQKQKQKVESKLFDAVYDLPQSKQQIKNYQQLQTKIQTVKAELIAHSKTNIEQIQRVCKTNSRLSPLARLLREHVPPQGLRQNSFSIIVSTIIQMFGLMMTSSKMIQFFNKLSIPFSLYRIILRMYCNCGKFQFLKKLQVEQCFKFISKMLSVKSKSFPRLYASLILNILNEYSQKMAQKQRKQGQDWGGNKQNDRMIECIKTVNQIALDLVKCNLRLAADSGILVAMYKKAIDSDLNTQMTVQLIQLIAEHMNTYESRQIIITHMDLCRVFALFTNVDGKLREGKTDEKIQRCAIMIEMLLSLSSTMLYFVSERVTLKNFVISLKSKSKSEKELSIINEKIFKNIIDKALRYDKDKMQRSNNHFGLYSNYLNYRALLIISYLLASTQIFQTFLKSDPNGDIFAGLGKISLMYFPNTFEKDRYNKQIIQTIKLPSVSNYQKISRDFLDVLSYYDYCILPYEFDKNQLISYLLYLKGLQNYKEQFSPQCKKSIQNLLERTKQSHSQDFDQLLLDFYAQIMKICEILLWRPKHLKLAKFLSVIIDYLRSRDYVAISNACLDIVNKIFTNPKKYYYRYLYITALDDAGKYFQQDSKTQELILSHYKNSQYSFRVSRIILHTDLNKRQPNSIKKIVQTICTEGCEDLVLQSIQKIRFYCIDNDDKADWGSRIICQKLIYHQNQQIACASVQFCEEFIIHHRIHKNYLYNIELPKIRDSNLRKRIMYLLLNSENGIDILNAYNQNFIKDEIDLWLKQGPNLVKDLSSFMSNQSKNFTSNKESGFLDVGKLSQNRHKLIYLPWNISVNGKYHIGLTSYEYLNEKIKLRVSPQLLVEGLIQISFFQIGGFTVVPNNNKSTIVVKREQVIKKYEENRVKQNRQIKKFTAERDRVKFYFKYETGILILEKLLITGPLARDVYPSLTYPLSFITVMTKTSKGLNYLRSYKFIQQCIKMCRFKQNKQQKDIEVQLSKGAIECLGMLFACWKLETLEKIQIFSVIFELFERTTNFNLKEVSLWALNIMVKDEDLRRKLKQAKGWLILESKYCGWLCYPQFYNQLDLTQRSICQFSHLNPQLLQKTNNQGYLLIVSVLQLPDKTDKDIYMQKIKKKQMMEFFKKPENKQHAWDPKLLERVVMYVSNVNFGFQRTRQVLDMFTDYFLSANFDTDFAFGSSLP